MGDLLRNWIWRSKKKIDHHSERELQKRNVLIYEPFPRAILKLIMKRENWIIFCSEVKNLIRMIVECIKQNMFQKYKYTAQIGCL